MSDDFGDIPISNIFSRYDLLEAGDIGDIDLYGLNIGSLYPDIVANMSASDFKNLMVDADLFAKFAEFDPKSAALLISGNLTPTGTSALTGEGLIADAAVDKIASELNNDTTKIADLTQDRKDVALVNPDDIKNLLSKSGNLSASDLLKYGLPALGSYLSYKSAKDAQKEAKGVSLGKNAPVTATKVSGKGVRYSAMGGLQSLAQGGKSSLPPRYLDGHTDGMADKVPAHIDNRRPAALSDGEFVVPADVVSHLGNGNSTAGAKRLYEMMDRIRAARTGTTKQGKQINPDKFLPR